jgi:hypothetical protein
VNGVFVLTIAVKQAKSKPLLNDVIASKINMSEEAKKTAYSFLDYCDAKKITYKWSSTNRWNLNMKGKTLGYIGLGEREKDNNSWSVIINSRELIQHEKFIHDEGLAEFVSKKLHYCQKCVCKCKGLSVMLNGTEYHGICNDGMNFKNPDNDTIQIIQKVLDFRLSIPHGTEKRPIYDSATDGLTRIANSSRIKSVINLDGSSNENINFLFDGTCVGYYYVGPYGKYKAVQESQTILFQLDEPAVLKMYGFVTALRLDVPNGWKFYGGNGENEWMLLDEKDRFPKPVTLYTEKAFVIKTPKKFKHYKIVFEGRNFVLSQVFLYV